MYEASAASADRELQLLGVMLESAYALGEAFAEAAKAETDPTRKIELFDAFNRGFLAVRMGIRLTMALRAPPKAAAASASIERDPPETEKTERVESDREREREYEPVSLPKFLRTLGVIAADAARLDVPLPANALPTLHDLLARTKTGAPVASPQPASGVSVLTRPSGPAPKTALLGSASAQRPMALRSPPLARPPPRASG